jgi:pimeloyl-ACP methyl ester carboxylesterase
MLARLRLARWLGPWADAAKAPRVERIEARVDELRVRVYARARRPRATFLVAPGLHYAGPDDPRMDRFCAVLAAAGHTVVAPFVPDYLALTPGAGAVRDFARVFAALPRWSAQKPVVFSISFGSLLAFSLAASHGEQLAGLVIFGGYADFHDTMRYCLGGERRDPLNQSVVLMNLLDVIDHAPGLPAADRAAVAAGWRRFVERTWGRPELKDPARHVPIAEELAPGVPEAVRALFLVGVGARPGAAPLAHDALTRFDARALDPSPYFARIPRGLPIDLVHGRDDDVIPYPQSEALYAALARPGVRLHLTGLYNHTGSQRPPLRAYLRELRTMWRVLGALAR